MQIDVLVKNEKHVKIQKNIGRIFRQYNIIEYKSPEDGSGTGRQRHILPHRDAIPIQLVIVQKLSKEHNYWLNNLRNDLKAGSEIKNFIESYSKNKNSKLYQALADAVMRANWEKLKEGSNMCEALKELFADDFKESELKGRNAGRIEGKIEGRTEGAASKIIELVIKKHQKGYTAEATADMLEEPVSRIRQIYDVIEKSSPDYDAETIYKQLHEKEE